MLVYRMLLAAGLPVELIGFMSDSSEEATDGDIAAYLPFQEAVWGRERFLELSPIDLETPDIALMPRGEPPVALVEVTSIKSLDQDRYHTLPTPPKDIKQFLANGDKKARYCEPGYIAYVIADWDRYTQPIGHTPRPKVFYGRPNPNWLQQELEYKFRLGGQLYNIPYHPHSADFFIDNDVRPLADELRQYLN
jgi:hypothetical protein